MSFQTLQSQLDASPSVYDVTPIKSEEICQTIRFDGVLVLRDLCFSLLKRALLDTNKLKQGLLDTS